MKMYELVRMWDDGGTFSQVIEEVLAIGSKGDLDEYCVKEGLRGGYVVRESKIKVIGEVFQVKN